MKKEKKVLFVRSGGGMPGLDIHIGIWRALSDAGITSTENIGTSAGAIISALDSGGMFASEAEQRIRALSDKDVRKERFAWKLRALWVDAFLSHEPVRKLFAQLLPVGWSSLAKPLSVVAINEHNGLVREFDPQSHVDMHNAILASMSIAGVFPPVFFPESGGRYMSDGGPIEYVPLHPNPMWFDEVWVLVANAPYEYTPKKESVVSRFLMSMSVAIQAQIRRACRDYKLIHGEKTKVYIIRPDVGRSSSCLRFDHSLIPKARVAAAEQIRAQLSG